MNDLEIARATTDQIGRRMYQVKVWLGGKLTEQFRDGLEIELMALDRELVRRSKFRV